MNYVLASLLVMTFNQFFANAYYPPQQCPQPIRQPSIVESVVLEEPSQCPAGWVFSPNNPVFPSTCFKFIANPAVRCGQQPCAPRRGFPCSSEDDFVKSRLNDFNHENGGCRYNDHEDRERYREEEEEFLAVVGVCIYDQRITLRRVTGLGQALKFSCPCGSLPVERNGAWRCIELRDPLVVEDLTECPPNSYPQCMVIRKLLTPL